MSHKSKFWEVIGLLLTLAFHPSLFAAPGLGPLESSVVANARTTSVEVRIPKSSHKKPLSSVYLQVRENENLDLHVPVAFREELSDYFISLVIPNSLAEKAVLSISHQFPLDPQEDGSVDLEAAIKAAENYEIAIKEPEVPKTSPAPEKTDKIHLTVRNEWGAVFSELDTEGTIVVIDERTNAVGSFVFNKKRAGKRFSPASTFKIPHALFAIDAGLVRDEFQVIPWDGQTRPYETWNRDQTLRSSMKNSVVWVYQAFADALGDARERSYMEKIHYGNADSTGDSPFWVEGNLRISAREQIDFLQKFYRNELPFDRDAQRLVKDVMINEAGPDWILRAKTGWSGTVGWWVGWVEHPDGPVFFALNIDTPNRIDDLPKREEIVRRILTSIDAIPGKSR